MDDRGRRDPRREMRPACQRERPGGAAGAGRLDELPRRHRRRLRHPDAREPGKRARRDADDDAAPCRRGARSRCRDGGRRPASRGRWSAEGCAGRRGRSRPRSTVGSDSTRRSSEPPSSASRLVPSSGASARRTCCLTSGEPPAISICPTANIDVWRAAAYAPTARAASARPTRSERPEGRKRAGRRRRGRRRRQRRQRRARRGGRPAVDRRWRSHPPRFAARGAAPTSQPPSGGSSSAPEELDLVPQLDAVLLVGAPARLGHQRDRVRAPRAVRRSR